MISISISEAVNKYFGVVKQARSPNTAHTYRNALAFMLRSLKEHQVDPQQVECSNIQEELITWLADALKPFAPSTERLYLTAVSGFFEYIAAEGFANPNLPKVRLLIRQRSRRPAQRLPQFPRQDIERILEYVKNSAFISTKNNANRLINLRDYAFLLTLADTGLRVHEACGLRRGDIEWEEYKAIIIGKGNKQDVVRFSSRCMNAIKAYLAARAEIDGSSGKPLASLPLFARHDRGAGKKIKPITTTTGRNIVTRIVLEVLGSEYVGTITPHSFRHYFVTTVLRGSGGNLKLAQSLARHRNIAVTQRYAHLSDDELDKGYWEIFENPET